MNSPIDRVLELARVDDRIRAIFLDGSRTDPAVAADAWQDFDIALIVSDLSGYLQDPDWIRVFGEPIMVQEPYKSAFGWGDAADDAHRYAWLMIFADGQRVDLQMMEIEHGVADFHNDALRQVLLDKDGLLPTKHLSTGAAFWHTPPTEDEYLACSNEFWWCLNNVAKATARDQYPMAVSHLESPVRDMLYQMLGWYVGELHAWHVSIGKQGKFLANLLPTEDYALLLSTYPHAVRDDIWKAIHGITTLFRSAARHVAVSQEFGYPSHWDEGMSAWLAAVEQGQVPGEMELDNHQNQ